MGILEIIALISTILCVVLSSKVHILAWPLGIISVISLVCIYVPNGMYAQVLLQLVFLVQCIIGWVNWGKKDTNMPNVEEKNAVVMSLCVAIGLGTAYSIVIMFINGTDNVILTYLDGISAFLALLGNWYLTKKTIQAWPIFMAYNILLMFILVSQGIYSLALLNICLFFISFNAYRVWRRDLIKV